MKKCLLFVLFTGVSFCQVDTNKVSAFINSFNRDKMKLVIKENESIFKIDNFKNPQVKFGNYLAFNNFPAHYHNQYFKVGNKLIIDSNYDKFMYDNNIIYDNGLLGTWTDKQVPNTYSHYADPVMETLMMKVLPIMQQKTGLQLLPCLLYTSPSPRD